MGVALESCSPDRWKTSAEPTRAAVPRDADDGISFDFNVLSTNLIVTSLGAGIEGSEAIGRSLNSLPINKKEGLMKNQKKVLSTIIAALGCSLVGSASANGSVVLTGRVASVDPAAEYCFQRLNEWIAKPSTAPSSCTTGTYANTLVSVALPNDPTDGDTAYRITARVHTTNTGTYCHLVEVNPTNGAFVSSGTDFAVSSPADQALTLASGHMFGPNQVNSVECNLKANSFLRSVKVEPI